MPSRLFFLAPIRLLPALLALLLLLSAPHPVRAQNAAAEPPLPEGRLEMLYAVWVGGLHVLDLELALMRKGQSWEVDLEGENRGVWAWTRSFRVRAEGDGGFGAGGALSPERMDLDRRWGEEKYLTTRFRYLGGIAEASQEPKKFKKKDLLPAETRRGAVDAVTALLRAALEYRGANACPRRIPIFDGRYRYDLVGYDRGSDQVSADEASVYAGPARRCDFDVALVAGFKPDKSGWWDNYRPEVKPRTLVPVFFAPVESSGLPGPLPVRIEGDAGYGRFLVYLSSVRFVAADPS